VSTASTKRARKKGRQQRQPTKPAPADEDLRPRVGEEVSERAWGAATVIILAAAAALRFYALGVKPLHHDEGVNGFFLSNLISGLGYRYDPQNYHGPSLYFMTAPVAKLAGLKTYAVRGVVALFGLGTVWLVLALRRNLGAVATLTAAALLAVSPGAVYYSRYFIHETPFVFFTLAAVVAALRFYETSQPGQLMLVALSLALLFTTKETAFISVGTLLLAALVAHLWARWAGGAAERRRKGGESGLGAAFSRMGGNALVYGGVAALVFAAVYVLLYTSFFTNPKGFSDSFAAFDVWSRTGTSDFHAKPFHTYVKWLLEEEAPTLFLASVGALVALFEPRKNRFAVFACAWGFGLLVAYSLIKYKTPWLVLSFLPPLCLAAGYALQALWRVGGAWLSLTFAGAALAVGLSQSAVLNFVRYDDDRYPYVYSHTQREALDLVREVERLGVRAGRTPRVTVASPEYWPLPWYFQQIPGVAYEQRVNANYDPLTVDAVIGRESDNPAEDQTAKLRTALGANYQKVGTYPLRPGVKLALFVRKDLVEANGSH
jgi:uncharacterized protein (TIGR03663 family)